MIYLYKNPKSGEVKEVFQKMKDKHVYKENGIEWDRVFLAPQVSIDTNIGAFSEAKFIEKTKSGGKIGDLYDMAKEASDKRAQERGGVDPIKEKYKEDYSKARCGKKLKD